MEILTLLDQKTRLYLFSGVECEPGLSRIYILNDCRREISRRTRELVFSRNSQKELEDFYLFQKWVIPLLNIAVHI